MVSESMTRLTSEDLYEQIRRVPWTAVSIFEDAEGRAFQGLLSDVIRPDFSADAFDDVALDDAGQSIVVGLLSTLTTSFALGLLLDWLARLCVHDRYEGSDDAFDVSGSWLIEVLVRAWIQLATDMELPEALAGRARACSQSLRGVCPVSMMEVFEDMDRAAGSGGPA